MNDQLLIGGLEEFFAKDIHEACARKTNLRRKPKACDTKTAFTDKRVFGDFL